MTATHAIDCDLDEDCTCGVAEAEEEARVRVEVDDLMLVKGGPYAGQTGTVVAKVGDNFVRVRSGEVEFEIHRTLVQPVVEVEAERAERRVRRSAADLHALALQLQADLEALAGPDVRNRRAFAKRYAEAGRRELERLGLYPGPR